MENGDSSNSKKQAAKGLTPSGPNIEAKKKTGRTKPTQNKSAKNKKKWSLWRHWKSASNRQRAKWVAEGVGGLIALGVLIVYITGLRQTKWIFWAEHKPLIIHSRPPEFLQTFACKVGSGPGSGSHFGNVDKIYKNVGNRTAYDVFPLLTMAKVVPEKRTGEKAWDDRMTISRKDCDMSIAMGGAPLEPGVEQVLHQRQGVISLPP